MRFLVAVLCASALAYTSYRIHVSEPKKHMDRPFKPPGESEQLKRARERWEEKRTKWIQELGGDPLLLMGKENEAEEYRVYERLRNEDYKRRQATYDSQEAYLLKEYLAWENTPPPPNKEWAKPLATTAAVAAITALPRMTRGLACLFAGAGNLAALVMCLYNGKTKDVFGFDRQGLATFTACALGAWVGLFTGLFYFRRARTTKVAASKKKKS